MFYYRFVCTSKENALFRINQMITNDAPCGKSIFGGDLYKAGIHFQVCDKNIKGFYVDETDDESYKGAGIRVGFTGHFIDENENLFFGVWIYPRISEVMFLLFAVIALSAFGKVVGIIIAIAVFCLFAKGYCTMIKETYDRLKHIFC